MSIWYFHFFLLQSDVNSCLFIFISFSEFEIKTLKGLEQIKTQVNYNTSLLLQIIKKVDVQQTVDAEDNDDNELPVLPIKTMLQLEGVENALKVDTTKNRLVSNSLFHIRHVCRNFEMLWFFFSFHGFIGHIWALVNPCIHHLRYLITKSSFIYLYIRTKPRMTSLRHLLVFHMFQGNNSLIIFQERFFYSKYLMTSNGYFWTLTVNRF